MEKTEQTKDRTIRPAFTDEEWGKLKMVSQVAGVTLTQYFENLARAALKYSK
jgi:hypothetical protein